VLNQWGLMVARECATANVADNTLQWLIRQFEERMMVLSDTTWGSRAIRAETHDFIGKKNQ